MQRRFSFFLVAAMSIASEAVAQQPRRAGSASRIPAPSTAAVRSFDLATGKPLKSIPVAEDGTIYATNSGSEDDPQSWAVWKIAPGAKLIAENIRSAASLCYDSGANQLVIPMNANNGLAFVSLKGIWAPKKKPL